MSPLLNISSVLFCLLFLSHTMTYAQRLSSPYLAEDECTSTFNDDVKTYSLFDHSGEIGYSIWLNRKSQRVKAKYFAHKDTYANQTVQQRYDGWRTGRNVILISSGAYATGWSAPDVPTGITVDNGVVVNKSIIEDMDGLVIVEAVGGIRISNIEDGDLNISTETGTSRANPKTSNRDFIVELFRG